MLIKTFSMVDAEQRRSMSLRRAEAGEGQKPRWALVVVTIYPSVKRRTLDRILGRSEATLAYRIISVTGALESRSEETDAEKKDMKRYSDQLNRRFMLHGGRHRVSQRSALIHPQISNA